MRQILATVALLLIAAPLWAANTWTIRPDGGSRYDATNYPYGQCAGNYDAAYPGTHTWNWTPGTAVAVGVITEDYNGNLWHATIAGTTANVNFLTGPAHGSTTINVTTLTDGTVTWTAGDLAGNIIGLVNQNCSFDDVRFLWQNGASAGAWAIAGGDTVIIDNTYPSGETGWRIGGSNNTGKPFFGYGGVGDLWPQTAYNLPIPAGTSANPTIIEGANYASCSTTITAPGAPSTTGPDPTKTSQLYGGWIVSDVFNLSNTQHVIFRCLEITDHSACIAYGSTAPAPTDGTCNHSTQPYTDYAGSGILINNQSSDITMQDVYVHGMPASGIVGAIGGAITMTRVEDDFNGFAGWNFDDHTPNNPTSSITANYVTMDWNGCDEEYPVTDAWPGTYCYSISNGGFGDAWSGQDAEIATVLCDHCQMAYNVKDAFFGPHTYLANATVENSVAMGNGGQTWKGNLALAGNLTFENNLTKNNCFRLTAAFSMMTSTQAGEFANYLNLNDMCRPGADGAAMTITMPTTGSVTIVGNTFVMASPKVGLDLGCTSTIASLTISAGGSNYVVGDVLDLGGTGGQATVSSVSSGAITGLTLTNGGQWYFPSFPYLETYIWDETTPAANLTTTNAQIYFETRTNLTCTGGARVLKDNLFLGYADYTAQNYFGGGTGGGTPIRLFCYADGVCGSGPGSFTDADWTDRSHNLFYDFNNTDSGMCSYANETCTTSPLLVSQPAGPSYASESFLDNFNFNLSASSPAIGAGIAYTGLTTDFSGVTRPNPPSIGALEYNAVTAPSTTDPHLLMISWVDARKMLEGAE